MRSYKRTGQIFLVLLVIITMTMAASTAGAAGVDDKTADPGTLNLKTIYRNGEVMVSLRQMAADSDWSLYYVKDTKMVLINNGEQIVRLSINEGRLDSNKLTHEPVIIKGRTYVDFKTAGLILKEIGKGMNELLTSLTTDKKVYKRGEDAVARIRVYNPTDKTIELKYGSGQLYDLYLLSGEREVWRWSKGKFFTMALIRRELKPGEELSYEVKIPLDFEQGIYTLTGILATQEPVKLAEVEIEIK